MDKINTLLNTATDKALNNPNHKNALSTKQLILSNVTQDTRQLAGQLKIAISAFVVSLLSLVWFFNLGKLEAPGMLVISGWCVGSAIYTLYLARKKRDAQSSLININVDLFEHCRKDIRFKIKVIKLLGPVMLIEAIAVMALVLVKQTSVAGGLPIFVTLSALFAGFVIYQYAAVLPRLTLELKLLSGEV